MVKLAPLSRNTRRETNSVPIEGNTFCPRGPDPNLTASRTPRFSSLGLLQHRLKVHFGGENDVAFGIPT